MTDEYNAEREIVISAKELSEFARAPSRTSSVECTPSVPSYGDPDDRYPLSYRTINRGRVFVVTGEADGIYTFGDELLVEMRREVRSIRPGVTPLSYPEFLAEAFTVAYLALYRKRRHSVTLKAVLCSKGRDKHFDFHLTGEYLARSVEALLDRAAPFAIVKNNFDIRGRRDIASMPFPYTSIREGQRDFVEAAYRAIKRGERLLVSAPTGIGKTVSALFPAVKALGEGKIEKIFYLTAKTVTGLAAAKTAEALSSHAKDLRAVMIIAKERSCPSNDKNNPFFVASCSHDCPRLSDNEAGEYKRRRDAALEELLAAGNVFRKDEVYAAAERHFLCPYELSLDLSEYCQIVICDYNYAFDPSVKFRRYFFGGTLKYAFLIDEAHNLPDRARAMFSSSLSSGGVTRLIDKISARPSLGAVVSACDGVLRELCRIGERCRAEAEISGDEIVGYIKESSIPSSLIKSLENFVRAVPPPEGDEDDGIRSALDDAKDACGDLIKAAEYFDEHFVFFSELRGDEVTVSVMCLDPSEILGRALDGAVSSILFSATLTPTEYFAEVTGCAGGTTLELPSPYPRENLRVAAVDGVSTKYLSRGSTADDIAKIILSAVSSKEGHYIAYFPSYSYMQTVFESFRRIAPQGIRAVVQKRGMSLQARDKFLSFFEDDTASGTLVGFCVLGGVFSEGIDLPDEKLIGAVIVGIGLPGFSSELNVLKEYYDSVNDEGYSFTYLYPAMIKIAQAAGRVIRGECDRGVIVLVDERYASPDVIKLLPSHWRDLRLVGDAPSLGKYLSDFWDKNEAGAK
ncbi:MAG: ATP-dependent DNA helicase [Clostridia bacterium]|nr:ATP-dependent DNA helicase [Clostridia bacterium]